MSNIFITSEPSRYPSPLDVKVSSLRLFKQRSAHYARLKWISSLWLTSLFLVTPVIAQLSFDPGISTEDPELEALYRDLSSLVIFHERLDWISDAHSLTMMEGKLLEVTCQVRPETLTTLSALLTQEVDERGSVELRWREAMRAAQGGEAEPPSLSAFHSDLRRERILMSVKRGLERLDDCPFWLSPRRDYKGIHRDAGRFQLVLESMSSLQVVRARGGWSLKGSQVGGSGQGRLLIARGLTLKAALASGIELGGASTFPTNEEGKRELNGVLTGGVPLVVRWWFGGLRLDSEVSFLARFPEGQEELLGFRVSQGVGVSTLRVSGLLPHFMLWTGFESFFPPGEERVSIFRIGTRVGFSWGS